MNTLNQIKVENKLYDIEDTQARETINANKEMTDKELKNKATIEDMTTYIEEHKDELKGVDGKDGKDGADGKTPVKGTDYYTEADKQEMVQLVLTELPKYNGGVS